MVVDPSVVAPERVPERRLVDEAQPLVQPASLRVRVVHVEPDPLQPEPPEPEPEQRADRVTAESAARVPRIPDRDAEARAAVREVDLHQAARADGPAIDAQADDEEPLVAPVAFEDAIEPALLGGLRERGAGAQVAGR